MAGADAWAGSQAEPAPMAGPATRLDGVSAETVEGGSMVQLVANGPVESAVAFTLENPARLVVDLPDFASEVDEQTLEVGSDQVERVRVGSPRRQGARGDRRRQCRELLRRPPPGAGAHRSAGGAGRGPGPG